MQQSKVLRISSRYWITMKGLSSRYLIVFGSAFTDHGKMTVSRIMLASDNWYIPE